MPIYICTRDGNAVKVKPHVGKLPTYHNAKGEFPCEFGKVYVSSDDYFIVMVAPTADHAGQLAQRLFLKERN
jgi:hypothetical protein